MLITPDQIRAARALKGWSQGDLAERTGLAVPTIANIEISKQDPSAKTIEKILLAFEANGIEFTENEGVRKASNIIRTLSGSEGFKTFLDEVYETAKATGGDFCILNGLQSYWYDWLDNDWYKNVHLTRMREYKDNLDFKIVGQEGEEHRIGVGYSEFRWMPKNLFSQKASFYSFADKLAFLDFQKDNISINVLQNKNFAEGFRILFNAAWDHLTIKPKLNKKAGK